MNENAKQAYAFILQYHREHSMIPSYDEIAAELQISTSTAYRYVGWLVEAGKLKRPGNKSRALVIVNPNDDVEIKPPQQQSSWGALILHDDGYEIVSINVVSKRRKPYEDSIQATYLTNLYRQLGYPIADHRSGVRHRRKTS